ncbi:hypothetical protein JW848_06545 [Candidatus Bipolaricaulota bacterium]|nr:hypothetical protein [Candidatus Bipolaricaulota bacterium]
MFSFSDLLVQVGRRQRRQRGLYGATWVFLSFTIVVWGLFAVDLIAPVLSSDRLLICLWLAPVIASLLTSAIASRQRINIGDLLLRIDQRLVTGERLSSLYEVSLRDGPDVFRYRIEKTLRGKPLQWRRATPFHRPTLAILCVAVLLWGGLGGMVARTSGSSLSSGNEVSGLLAGGGVRLDPDGVSPAEEARSGDDEQPADRSGEGAEAWSEDTSRIQGTVLGSSAQVDVDDDLFAALAALEAFVTTEVAVTDAGFGDLEQDSGRRDEALARAQSLLESAQSRISSGETISQADLDEMNALATTLTRTFDETTLAALSESPVASGDLRDEQAAYTESLENEGGSAVGADGQERRDDIDQEGQSAGDSSAEEALGESGGLDAPGAEGTQRPLVSALGAPGFVTERLGGALTSATTFRELLTQGIPIEPIYDAAGEAVSALQLDPLSLQAIVEQRSLSMRERDLIEAYFRAITQGGT